jgi:hypothetical protein
MNVLRTAALALAWSLIASTLVRAGIPSAGTSFVSAHIVICPAGDSMVVVVAHHADGNPWAEGPIWVEVCDCSGVRLSAVRPACSAPDTSHCHVTMTPDLYGVAEIPISGGGSCPGGSVRVLAGGVLLALRSEPACFDQNGDLRVDSTDVAIVTSKLGTHDAGADFDGDGTVTPNDLSILQTHLGHSSPDAGPASSAVPAHSMPAKRAAGPRPGTRVN